ncbi:MAG TPA: SDR family NAD(P)-dependent oxidoreductase, partial [Burkholderiaceae bacterium]|nr:SDR family NAD(P)-dependent oxidoreductase [Burkholderiaceae bacterium]
MTTKTLMGQVAVVTGAARGIGLGIAQRLSHSGCKVVLLDRDGEALEAAKKTFTQRDAVAHAFAADLTDTAQVTRAIGEVQQALGRIDILVNNAGIVRDAMVFNMTEADWDAVIRVHLKGTFAPTHHAARYWRARSKAGERVAGRVINTTSGAGLSGNVGQANYTAAKAGIVGLTLTASLELARIGVTVNCVAPGGTTRIMGT